LNPLRSYLTGKGLAVSPSCPSDPDTSIRATRRGEGSGLEKGKMLIQHHFDVTREELKSIRQGDSRKVCVYLIKRHSAATNREIAELFGNLRYSAVAKIDRSVSSGLAADDDLRELIERMQAEYSFFKA
jgi:hypothetical protein